MYGHTLAKWQCKKPNIYKFSTHTFQTATGRIMTKKLQTFPSLAHTKMKKGQLLGQPLVYAFALIVGALILVWGISTILKLKDTAGATELAKFASKVESETQQYLNFDEGSTTTIKIILPDKIKYLCFYESQKPQKCMLDGKPCIITQIDESFAAIANTKTQDNMFFLPYGAYNLPPKEVKKLQVAADAGNPVCFRNDQRKELTLTSMGTYVAVS